MRKQKGITLIALVITIIVIFILAGVVIQTLTGDNSILSKTTEAEFKNEIKQYEEELKLKIANEEIDTLGNRENLINVFKVFPSTGGENSNFETEMKTYIPSFNNSKYGSKLEIRNDELIYTDEGNEQERKWFGEVNLSLSKYFITVNYVDKDGNVLSEPETKTTITGVYEIEPKQIDGYESEKPIYEGKTKGDTEITITYLPESGDLAYIGLDENGNETEDESKIVSYTISGIGNFTGEDLVIPKTYNNKPVTQVKEKAFLRNETIKKLIVPETIKKVNSEAFRSLKIEYMNFNGENAYYKSLGSVSLKKVEIGKNVKLILDRIFESRVLTDVKVYTEQADINAGTFENCSELKDIYINSSNNRYKAINGIVYSIDEKKICLYAPGRIGEFTIASNIEEIGNNAFHYNKNLGPNIIIPTNVKIIRSGAFGGCNLQNIYLNGEKTEYAAFGTNPVINLEIGENCKFINDRTFTGCNNLQNIYVYTNTADINAWQFEGCQSIKKIEVNENNTKYSAIDNTLYSKNGEKLYFYPPGNNEKFIIPNGVKELGEYSIRWNYNIKELEIPSSLEKISNSALSGSKNIEKITYNDTIEKWNNINKATNWKNNIKATKVICTNGESDL